VRKAKEERDRKIGIWRRKDGERMKKACSEGQKGT
jgi:hypothetical protein